MMKKMYLRQLNLRNFMRIQELKKMKNNSLKFLELHIMNLKILERTWFMIRGSVLKFDNTYQIKLTKYEGLILNVIHIMTLPVSIATTERYFSVMKINKNRLRNKMEIEFLPSSMLIYIERDTVLNFSSDSIIEYTFVCFE